MSGRRGVQTPRAASLAVIGVPRSGTTPEVRTRFDELSRRLLRRAGALPDEQRVGSAGTHRTQPLLQSGESLEECLQMRRVRGTDGDVLVREVVRSLPRALSDACPATDPSAVHARDAVIVDLETAGLANAPIVLAGCAEIRGDTVVLRQILAESYPAEHLLLTLLAREIAGHPVTVTFNGGTFDLPLAAARCVLHRLSPPRPARHVDLLPLARRVYRRSLENRRLATLEQRVLGRHRVGDLPSREVPALFHRFLRSGEPAEVAPVIRHNEEDLVSMAGLAVTLGAVRTSEHDPVFSLLSA